MGELTELLNQDNLEKLDRDQLITLLLAAVEQINVLERKIIELTGRIAELEGRLNQNSSNSSKPPSSDGYTKPEPKSQRKKSGKKPGGQKGHKGHGVSMAEAVTETILITPHVCTCCGENLGNVMGHKTDTHYVMEIPPMTVAVSEYIREAKECPSCGKSVSASFPYEAQGTQQYGPRLKAFIVLLCETGMVAMNRVVEILGAISGIQVSVGTVAHTLDRCGQNLEEAVKSIKEAVKGAKVGHFDESGMRSQGRLSWLHTASTRYLSYLAIHNKRGREAMDAIGILKDFKGTAVHDCLASYWHYDCVHSLCNAHLLRELTFIDESTGQSWAQAMIELLLKIKQAVAMRRLCAKTFLPKVELSNYIVDP